MSVFSSIHFTITGLKNMVRYIGGLCVGVPLELNQEMCILVMLPYYRHL